MSCTRCEELEAEVARLSMDSLTGLLGRQVFDRALKTEFAKAQRYHRGIGIIMIDVDHFKRFNDYHGHLVGDTVLAGVAARVKESLRECDIAARFGGEEFVVLTDGAGSLEVLAERIRMAVCGEAILGHHVSVSVGFAIQDERDDGGLEVVSRADDALYRAKNNGRNCVESGC